MADYVSPPPIAPPYAPPSANFVINWQPSQTLGEDDPPSTDPNVVTSDRLAYGDFNRLYAGLRPMFHDAPTEPITPASYDPSNYTNTNGRSGHTNLNEPVPFPGDINFPDSDPHGCTITNVNKNFGLNQLVHECIRRGWALQLMVPSQSQSNVPMVQPVEYFLAAVSPHFDFFARDATASVGAPVPELLSLADAPDGFNAGGTPMGMLLDALCDVINTIRDLEGNPKINFTKYPFAHHDAGTSDPLAFDSNDMRELREALDTDTVIRFLDSNFYWPRIGQQDPNDPNIIAPCATDSSQGVVPQSSITKFVTSDPRKFPQILPCLPEFTWMTEDKPVVDVLTFSRPPANRLFFKCFYQRYFTGMEKSFYMTAGGRALGESYPYISDSFLGYDTYPYNDEPFDMNQVLNVAQWFSSPYASPPGDSMWHKGGYGINPLNGTMGCTAAICPVGTLSLDGSQKRAGQAGMMGYHVLASENLVSLANTWGPIDSPFKRNVGTPYETHTAIPAQASATNDPQQWIIESEQPVILLYLAPTYCPGLGGYSGHPAGGPPRFPTYQCSLIQGELAISQNFWTPDNTIFNTTIRMGHVGGLSEVGATYVGDRYCGGYHPGSALILDLGVSLYKSSPGELNSSVSWQIVRTHWRHLRSLLRFPYPVGVPPIVETKINFYADLDRFNTDSGPINGSITLCKDAGRNLGGRHMPCYNYTGDYWEQVAGADKTFNVTQVAAVGVDPLEIVVTVDNPSVPDDPTVVSGITYALSTPEEISANMDPTAHPQLPDPPDISANNYINSPHLPPVVGPSGTRMPADGDPLIYVTASNFMQRYTKLYSTYPWLLDFQQVDGTSDQPLMRNALHRTRMYIKVSKPPAPVPAPDNT